MLLYERMLKMGGGLSSLLRRVLVLSCNTAGTLPLPEGRMLVGWTLTLSFSLSLLSSLTHPLVTEE